MSRTSRKLLSSLTQDYLWMSTLTNQPFAKLSDNLTNVSKKFHCAANTPVETEWSRTQAGHVETTGETKDNNSNKSSSKIPVVLRSATAGSAVSFPFSARTQEWNKAVNELTDLASEQLAEATLLETKRQIFS